MTRLHRRFRALALAALATGLVPLALAARIVDPVQRAGAHFGWNVAISILAGAGCAAAAATFARGDAGRAGWRLLALSYLVFVPFALAAGPSPSGLYEGTLASPWAAFAGNVAWSGLAIAAYVLLARAWSESGLDPGDRRGRLAIQAGAVAVAALLVGPDLLEVLPGALAGDPVAISDALTDLFDGALFVVAAPVLRAALALGGGLVAWPWVMLTASVGGWLFFDAVAIYGEGAGFSPGQTRTAAEVFRTYGALFALAAAVAQRWLMTAHATEEPRADEDAAA